jgi:hypothetical protein
MSPDIIASFVIEAKCGFDMRAAEENGDRDGSGNLPRGARRA